VATDTVDVGESSVSRQVIEANEAMHKTICQLWFDE
jgi:hypothetical protein